MASSAPSVDDGYLFPLPEAKAPKPGSLAALRDEFRRFRAISLEEGGLITQSQAARYLGVHPARVLALVRKGTLRAFRFPEIGMIGVSASDVQRRMKAKADGTLPRGRPKGKG